MKKILPHLLLALLVVGCEQDISTESDAGENSNEFIIGTWEYYCRENINGNQYAFKSDMEEGSFDYYFVFNDGSGFSMVNNELNEQFYWSKKNTLLNFSFTIVDGEELKQIMEATSWYYTMTNVTLKIGLEYSNGQKEDILVLKKI